MIVLGLDPGPTRAGLAMLTVEPRRPAHLEHGEHVVTAHVLPWLRHRVRHGGRVDLVAVEVVEGYAHGPRAHAKSLALGLTQRWEGRLMQGALDLGLKVRTARAVDWRLALCRDAQASNATIAATLTALGVTGLGVTNNHVRDALALGWAVGASLCPSEVAS